MVKDNVASLSIAVLYLLGQMDAKGMNKERTEKNNVETFKSLERDENKRKNKKKKRNTCNITKAERRSLTGGSLHTQIPIADIQWT